MKFCTCLTSHQPFHSYVSSFSTSHFYHNSNFQRFIDSIYCWSHFKCFIKILPNQMAGYAKNQTPPFYKETALFHPWEDPCCVRPQDDSPPCFIWWVLDVKQGHHSLKYPLDPIAGSKMSVLKIRPWDQAKTCTAVFPLLLQYHPGFFLAWWLNCKAGEERAAPLSMPHLLEMKREAWTAQPKGDPDPEAPTSFLKALTHLRRMAILTTSACSSSCCILKQTIEPSGGEHGEQGRCSLKDTLWDRGFLAKVAACAPVPSIEDLHPAHGPGTQTPLPCLILEAFGQQGPKPSTLSSLWTSARSKSPLCPSLGFSNRHGIEMHCLCLETPFSQHRTFDLMENT